MFAQDVRIKNVIHLLAGDSDYQRVQCIVLARAARPLAGFLFSIPSRFDLLWSIRLESHAS